MNVETRTEARAFAIVPQKSGVSADIERLEVRFSSLLMTGTGMTRDDVEQVRDQLKHIGRLVRTLEDQPGHVTLNGDVAAALEEVTKAETALSVVKAVLAGRIHSEEIDPAGSATGWLKRAGGHIHAAEGRVSRRSARS